MEVILLSAPTEEDWKECKRRALVTMYGKGLGEVNLPESEWRHKILEARHSPIRYLRYSFLIKGIPSNISVHLCRHKHAQPYVSSLRNDRQDVMDGDKAPRDTPVNMIIDLNAEELMTIANKRLCNLAAEKARQAVRMMCGKALEATPELEGLLVPMCVYHGGVCHEMFPCKKQEPDKPADFSIKGIIKEIGRCNEEHGFRTVNTSPSDFVALIHSEVSEMLEEFRSGHEATETYYRESDGKPEGVPAELSDIVIRCFDMADFYGIDLEAAITEKFEFNKTRPYLHGKKF